MLNMNRAIRRARTLNAVKRQCKMSNRNKNEAPGKYKKRKALDCGNPQCHVCHLDKILGVPDCQRVKFDISDKEQITEYRRDA